MISNTITSFRGKYFFLSNFCSCEVWYEGIMYPSVEHAYQAAKTYNQGDRRRIATAETATEAKRMGRKVRLRANWDTTRRLVMYKLLKQKFSIGSLKSRLLRTGKAELIEGNWWGDSYWGVYKGIGKNILGKLLMRVRREL